MQHYKVSFYNSGGYKSTAMISTDCLIQTDAEGNRQVIHDDNVIGGDELIEQLLNESQGWVEECCVFRVELINQNDVTQAVDLFKSGNISIGKAAKLAGMSLVEFTGYVSRLGIPVVNYNPAELDNELDIWSVGQ